MTASNRPAWAWALYDWANSAFATTVMAGFFPVFYKTWWNAGVPVVDSTFRLGVINSAASLLVALGAPLLGAVADRMGNRKRLLLVFAATGMVATGALALLAQGQWIAASLLYVIAILGFSGGNLFYDALLVFVAGPGRLDRVSALGFALGYLGGGLLFALNVVMYLHPGWFGLPDGATAVRVAFLTVALWWALFSIPLLRWVPEPPGNHDESTRRAIAAGLRQLANTLFQIRRLPQAFLFLLAYWLYIDGVDTIIRMAVDYGLSIELPASALITALLITQFVAFPAALVFGRLGDRLGPKPSIMLALLVFLGVTTWAASMQTAREFYVLAAIIGLVLGGVQALSRSLFARLIPRAESAAFFGLYNMLGKFAAILGPLLVGATAAATGNPRAGILSVAILFVLGMLLLARVDVEQGHARARAAERNP